MKHDVRHLELMVRYCDDIAEVIHGFGSDVEDMDL